MGHPKQRPWEGCRLLLVEDDEDFADAQRALLTRAGFSVTLAATAKEALAALSVVGFALVLLDLSLPDRQGTEMIPEVLAVQPRCALVVLTGHNDAALAVRALRAGASDYLTKPIAGQALLDALASALARASVRERLESLRGVSYVTAGATSAWQEALSLLTAAANVPKTTVLLTGEPGVGKEIAATLIHQMSVRRERPLIAANAACFPAGLLESELFGHEAGAFTNAQKRKRGLLELADTGTLFLDEIGEMPLDLQAKLLRILEGQPFRRVGGESEILPDFRLLCATNRDLRAMVRDGKFREDLFHRLNVFAVRIPSLRERAADIERLTLHFLAQLSAGMGFTGATISPESLAVLQQHPWPGNIRELKNTVERALVLSGGDEITPRHLVLDAPLLALPPAPGLPAAPALPAPAPSSALPGAGSARLEDAIQQHVLAVFEDCGRNVTQAANRLGITRTTLRARLRAYGIRGAGTDEELS